MISERFERWLPVNGNTRPRRGLLLGMLAGFLGFNAWGSAAKRRKKKRKKKQKDRCGPGLTEIADRCAERCETSATCGQAFCRVSYDGQEEASVCSFFNFNGDCGGPTPCDAHEDCGENELCVVFNSCTMTACGQVSFG